VDVDARDDCRFNGRFYFVTNSDLGVGESVPNPGLKESKSVTLWCRRKATGFASNNEERRGDDQRIPIRVRSSTVKLRIRGRWFIMPWA
jgi:hypothetical protein